jgi:hypothetical protein
VPLYRPVITEMNAFLIRNVGLTSTWRWAIKGYVFVGVASFLSLLFARSLRRFGLGAGTIHGWRMIAVAYVLALPFLVALGLSDGIHAYYRALFIEGGSTRLFLHGAVILVEHLFIFGLILGGAIPEKGLDIPVNEKPRPAFWGWVGLTRPIFPRGALGPLLAATAVFGAVHLGKDLGEAISSLPGGFGLAFLTLRARSIWPGIVLHVFTGATIVGIAYATH